LGYTEEALKTGNSKQVTEDVWATALVLAFLKLSLSQIEDVWELSAAKARKWLKKTADVPEVDSIITDASDALTHAKNMGDGGWETNK